MKIIGMSTMSQRVGLLLLATLLVLGVAACAPGKAEVADLEVEGPALVMFYTDG